MRTMLQHITGRMKYVILAGLVLAGPLFAATPVEAATRYQLGISAGGSLLHMSDAKLARRLDDMKRLGTTWVRVDFSWHLLQPDNPTSFNWELYDRMIKATDSRGLKILAVLNYTTPWARESRCAALDLPKEAAEKCNPRGSEEFGRFAGAVAKHYKGKNIRGWEIWNEPNLSAYWKTMQSDGTVFVDPVQYASVANAAATQIRRYNPDCAIITGGLSPMFEPSYPHGMRQSDYLAAVLPHLKAHLFTGVGMHPYSWPVMPDRAAVYNAFYTVDKGAPKYNLRAIMKAAGWDDKEIWATEFGASTRGLRGQNTPIAHGRPDHVSEERQADIIKQGVEIWYKKENVGPIFIHSDSDEWLVARKNEGGFGMRRADGSKKPAYEAFQTAARRVHALNPRNR